jgi:hypothetical protein
VYVPSWSTSGNFTCPSFPFLSYYQQRRNMALSMKILASWKQLRVERRAKQRAKARSDEIDRQLREESKHCAIGQRQQHDILLIGSCFPSSAISATDVVWAQGTPGSEAEAFAIVKHMKIIHDDCLSEQLLAEFRLVIWKTLLENARDIVLVLRRLNLEYANCSTKVRSLTPLLSLCPLSWTCGPPFHRPIANTS